MHFKLSQPIFQQQLTCYVNPNKIYYFTKIQKIKKIRIKIYL